MAYVTINEQRLYYTKPRASATGPRNVVLIHGAGGTHLDWPPQLRRLAGAAVFAIDLPGHGRSAGGGRKLINEYAGDVLAFVESLGLKEVVLIGHSMGGAIAMTIGLQRPPAVAGLVLVSTGARLRVTDEILERALTDFTGVVATITEFAWAQDCPDELKALGREQLMKVAPTVLHGDYHACNAFDIMEQVADIKVPVLVISGTADRLTPPKYSQFLADHVPSGRLVSIQGGGHMVALEQPEAVASAVRDFLPTLDH